MNDAVGIGLTQIVLVISSKPQFVLFATLSFIVYVPAAVNLTERLFDPGVVHNEGSLKPLSIPKILPDCNTQPVDGVILQIDWLLAQPELDATLIEVALPVKFTTVFTQTGLLGDIEKFATGASDT